MNWLRKFRAASDDATEFVVVVVAWVGDVESGRPEPNLCDDGVMMELE